MCREEASLARSSPSIPAAQELKVCKKLDFRAKYFHKLTGNRACAPAARPKHQTVTIFDWDDTLLCTSWLRQRSHAAFDTSETRNLRDIGKQVRKLLESASKVGHTFIITNAMPGWVEDSCARWAPEVLPVLNKVRIISARAKFEPLYPECVEMWKIAAFLEVERELDSAIVTNLIVLGDADYEMLAARAMGRHFKRGCIKTIKFCPNPTHVEHLQQVDVVASQFERVVNIGRHLEVSLEREDSDEP